MSKKELGPRHEAHERGYRHADHELSDAEIAEQYGALIDRAIPLMMDTETMLDFIKGAEKGQKLEDRQEAERLRSLKRRRRHS